MAVTIKNLIPAKHLEDTITSQYVSTDTKTIIDTFVVTNTSASIASFSVNLVASGGSVADSSKIIDNASLVAGETYICYELVGQVLENGDSIHTLASSTNSLTIKSDGRQIT